MLPALRSEGSLDEGPASTERSNRDAAFLRNVGARFSASLFALYPEQREGSAFSFYPPLGPDISKKSVTANRPVAETPLRRKRRRRRQRRGKAGSRLIDPLSVALERMGAHQVNALPIVSRAAHRLEGVVTLRDVLALYGIAAPDRA